jgi:hypothetical protein
VCRNRFFLWGILPLSSFRMPLPPTGAPNGAPRATLSSS